MDTKKLLSGIKCTGCSACVDTCPVDAISTVYDSEGFLQPVIDSEKCVKCKKCINKCTARKEPSFKKILEGYVGYSKDSTIYGKSTSGGIFGQLATALINEGWYIAGAVLDCTELKVQHMLISDSVELNKLQGSKYIQSDAVGIYKKVEKLLNSGEKVLFSGTPCQIAALYSILNNKYENQLLTMEIICHGVGSPLLFKRNIEQQYQRNSAIESILFRIKEKYEKTGFNLKIQYQNGKDIMLPAHKDLYYYAYLQAMSYRESCYSCEYATSRRSADITIGDCNSYKDYKMPDSEKVLSIILINSSFGKEIFIKNKGLFELFPANIDKEISLNAQLSHPVERPDERDKILKNVRDADISQLKKTYLKPNKKTVISYRIKRIIPMNTRIIMRNMLRGILHGKH